MNNTYKGDTKGIETKIKALFERASEKILNKKSFGYVETPKSKKVLDVVRYAHIESDVSLITGGAGVDPAAHTHIATKNTAALQALMAKQAAKKDDNDD